MAIVVTPNGDQGQIERFQNLSLQFNAAGGVAPYTWAITAGGPPSQLSLNAATGLLSGLVTAGAGFYSFTVTATDSTAATGSATVSFTIIAPTWDQQVKSIPQSVKDECLREGRKIVAYNLNWQNVIQVNDQFYNACPVWPNLQGADTPPQPQSAYWRELDLPLDVFNLNISAVQGMLISILGANDSTDYFVIDTGDGAPFILSGFQAYYATIPVYKSTSQPVKVYFFKVANDPNFEIGSLLFKISFTNFEVKPLFTGQYVED